MVEILLALLITMTGVSRIEDPALVQIAGERVIEIQSVFSHEAMRQDTAEVLGWNRGYEDPVARIVAQWQGSPTHLALLVDPFYTRIGCAVDLGDDQITYYFACVLASPQSIVSGPETSSATPRPARTPIVTILPDTHTKGQPGTHNNSTNILAGVIGALLMLSALVSVGRRQR